VPDEVSEVQSSPAPPRSLPISRKALFALRAFYVAFFLVTLTLVSFGIAAKVASWSPSFHDQLHIWGLEPTQWGRVALRIADSSHTTESTPQFALDTGFSLVNLGLAAFLYRIKAGHAAAPLLGFALMGTAAVFNLQAQAVYEALPSSRFEIVFHDGFHVAAAFTYAMAMVVFPDGHLVPRWQRVPRLGLYAVAVAILLIPVALLRDAPRNVVLVMVFGIGVPLVGAAAQAYRYRRPGTEANRQLSRLLLIALGVAAAIGLWALLTGLQRSAEPAFQGRDVQVLPVQLYRVFQLALSIVPLALFAGIFRYRLFSVDKLVTRTLVYGALAGFVSAVYVVVVVGVGGIILGSGSGRANLPLSIAATFIVAVGFEPAKGRMERVANRLVYGRRATPYEVLSEFSTRVAEAAATEDLLERMAHVLADGTGADRADVWLAVDNELRPAATWPPNPTHTAAPLPIVAPTIPWINDVTNAVAVRHQGELFGALTVTKPANEELTTTEENLMNDLGRQAGLALRNVRLTTELRSRLEELRASRQRIVAAGDEERRRLERNLHDGAQQELVAVKVQLAIAEDMADELEGDTAPLLELLERLKGQTGEALENLRDLARGIYPPLLAAEGLRVALSAQARKASVEIELDANVGRFNQEIEAAVYFCCLEAFQNIAKYAGDCSVTATIREVDEGVEFVVEDTGCGFDRSQVAAGMGGRNMADRLEALDGTIDIDSTPGHGTRVRGWIPLELKPAAVELP